MHKSNYKGQDKVPSGVRSFDLQFKSGKFATYSGFYASTSEVI